MGIHQIGHLLSMDCVSGDGTTMELDLTRARRKGVITIRNDRETLATIELDQERIDQLRNFLHPRRGDPALCATGVGEGRIHPPPWPLRPCPLCGAPKL